MAGPKARYPLEAARTLRRVDVVAARNRLHEAQAARRTSDARLARAEDRLTRHRATPLPSAPASQPISAAMLQRDAAYRARQRQREERLAEAVATARRRHEHAEADLERARWELSTARAAETRIERHRERFDAARRRLAAEDDEREVESQWAARHAPDISRPEVQSGQTSHDPSVPKRRNLA